MILSSSRELSMTKMRDILSLQESFQQCRVAVIGDLMLDEYLWGHIERISPEAPVPILSVARRTSTLGGAGNVAENLRHWGVEVTFIGVVGQDETARQVYALLQAHGVNTKGVLTDPLRKTTRKARLMSLEHGLEAIVCSDYMKGVLSEKVLAAVFEFARVRGIRGIVAPKDSNAEKYRGANILMPNSTELRQMTSQRVNQDATQDPNQEMWLDTSARSLV